MWVSSLLFRIIGQHQCRRFNVCSIPCNNRWIVRGLMAITLQLDFPLGRFVQYPDQHEADEGQDEAG